MGEGTFHTWTDHWENQEDFTVEEWREEVIADDTRLGYREWVEHKREELKHGHLC
jgi:hypothetical protein